MGSTKRAPLVGLLMTLVLLVPAGRADAAQYWDLAYDPAGSGRIVAYGQVTFNNAKEMTHSNTLVDECGPGGGGDGFGLQIRPVIQTGVLTATGPWYTNTDGCGSVLTFGQSHRQVIVNGVARNIQTIRWQLFLTDEGTEYYQKQTPCLDNPYVDAYFCA
jgi:hypothetical protein